MAQVTINLDEEQQQRVRAIAAAQQKPEQEIYSDAITAYLLSLPEARDSADGAPADYGPLRRMIGMVKDGPSDMSVNHDVRPTDPVRRSSWIRAAGFP